MLDKTQQSQTSNACVLVSQFDLFTQVLHYEIDMLFQQFCGTSAAPRRREPPPKLTPPPRRKPPPREGEGPTATVAAWASPGRSSVDCEEEGRTGSRLERRRRDPPPYRLGLGDAGAVFSQTVYHNDEMVTKSGVDDFM
jgi:hypothetical protein